MGRTDHPKASSPPKGQGMVNQAYLNQVNDELIAAAPALALSHRQRI
jgi:hypothetical protein